LLVLNPQNQLLMIKRTNNDSWGVPGGSIELGETIEETLKREFFGLYSGKELYYQYPNGDQVYIVSAVYQTQIDDENISLNLEEHNEPRFSISTLYRRNQSPDKTNSERPAEAL
jgi:hypothetical protein